MSQCDVCGKEFARKGGLDKHKNNKVPCKSPVKLIQEALKQAGVGTEIVESPLTEFRNASTKFNKDTTREERVNQGIFFTPKKVRDLLFNKLSEMGVQPKRILEPSFGSGEFIHDARRLYPESHILGVEMSETLFKSVECGNSTLECKDFLEWNGGMADLIIGNPPYFTVKTDTMSAKEKKEFAKKNSECMSGRPNIFILFLYKCLKEHLEKGGILAFIIPTSLYNCSYYQPMRDYIAKNTTIRYLETLNKPGFYETTQETMLIVLENKKENDDYIFIPKSGHVYISPFYKELYKVTENTSTLSDLGLGVKTGNVVWNQVKDKLSDTGTLLVYASNINNCELKINNLLGKEKKQYIKGIDKPTLDGPVILVERGYGNSFSFNTVLVNEKGFYAENHINVVYPKTPAAEANLGRVLASFRDKRTGKFIEWFLANGSMSATDLETLVPIF